MKFKTAIITGASRGIGASIAKKMAENGYNVVINYIVEKDKAEAVANEINSKNGGRAVIFCADVSKAEEVNKMVEFAIKTFGKITCLVNNAGIDRMGLFHTMPDEEIDRVMQVNVKGVFNCAKSVLGGMIQNKYGKIINISSVLGQAGSSFEVVYSASKGAVIAFTKALAKEVGPSGINVNCICPGAINTDMMKAVNDASIQAIVDETPMGRVGESSDIANAVLYLASDEAEFITGQCLTVSGGWLV